MTNRANQNWPSEEVIEINDPKRLTHEQQIVSSHWSMYACDGFPIMKVSKGWIINVEPTSLWAPVGTYFPTVFKTKKAAIEFFNNLCMIRFHEWRGIA